MKLAPFSVEECSVGTGAACGSIYLDENFEKLIRKRFQEHGQESLLTERRLWDIVRHFDTSIKRQYNPFDESCDDEFEISVGISQDIPEMGLLDGYLKLSRLTSFSTTIANEIGRTSRVSSNPSSIRF